MIARRWRERRRAGVRMEATTSAEEFVREAPELPVMPPIAAGVVRQAEDPNADLHALAGIISRDASLALRVLKIANSSFYSMPRKVESLQQAIGLLGHSTLRSVVVAASLRDVFARFGLAERLLWEHAIAAGVAGAAIACVVSGFSQDEAFLGGLVHDVGKLLMYSQAESRYQEVMRLVCANQKSSIEAEVEVFGFDHADVGRHLLLRWGLSPRLSVAVGAHHDLAKADVESKPLAALLQVADRMCLHQGFGRRRPQPELDPAACPGARLLGLGGAELKLLLEQARASYERELSA